MERRGSSACGRQPNSMMHHTTPLPNLAEAKCILEVELRSGSWAERRSSPGGRGRTRDVKRPPSALSQITNLRQ